MPYYDFKCRACKELFEENIPMNNIKMPACPKCGADDSEKLITGCQISSGSSGGSCGKGGFT
jgi:putative FmdB family regulatory protein